MNQLFHFVPERSLKKNNRNTRYKQERRAKYINHEELSNLKGEYKAIISGETENKVAIETPVIELESKGLKP